MLNQLKGWHFYEIKIKKDLEYTKSNFSVSSNYAVRICTYRNIEKVEKIFTDLKIEHNILSFEITEIDHDWLKEDEAYWFPLYCVELNNTYFNLKELIEDILVGKLSGLDTDFNSLFGV